METLLFEIQNLRLVDKIYIFCRHLDVFDSFSIYPVEITCYEGYSIYH